MKEEPTRGRGRPRKEVKPVAVEKKKTAFQEHPQEENYSPKGIITEDELLGKVETIRKTGEELPPEHQTDISPGMQLENDLISLASGDDAEETTEGEPVAAAAQTGTAIEGDAIAEMENAMVLALLEEGLNLPKGFLCLSKEQDQKLLAMVRPDDLEIKKSQESYWTILTLLNVSKAMKYWVYNLRKKKEAKKKAEEKKKSEPDELTRNSSVEK